MDDVCDVQRLELPVAKERNESDCILEESVVRAQTNKICPSSPAYANGSRMSTIGLKTTFSLEFEISESLGRHAVEKNAYARWVDNRNCHVFLHGQCPVAQPGNSYN